MEQDLNYLFIVHTSVNQLKTERLLETIQIVIVSEVYVFYWRKKDSCRSASRKSGKDTFSLTDGGVLCILTRAGGRDKK